MSEYTRSQRTRDLFDDGVAILTSYLPADKDCPVRGVVSELSTTVGIQYLTIRRLTANGHHTHAIDVIRQSRVEGSERVSVVVYPGSTRARVIFTAPQYQRSLPLELPPVEDDAALDVAENILTSFEQSVKPPRHLHSALQPCFPELSRLL